jgi:catechol-2,3-dioxygenase
MAALQSQNALSARPSATEVRVSSSTKPFATSLAGRKLVQVALTTRDPERSKAFYRDMLGLRCCVRDPGMVFYQMLSGSWSAWSRA